MRSTEALMSEFAAALQFFDGFGENWYALEECLGYLDEWLPSDAYVLVIERAEEILQDEALDETISLLKVLHRTGESWARPIADGDRFDRPPVPFHALLHVTNTLAVAETTIAKGAQEAGIPLLR